MINENTNEILNVSLSGSESSDSDYEIQNINSENLLKEEVEIEQTPHHLSSESESSYERVICIELMNNSKIYLNYKLNWKIRDLLPLIFSHREFKNLYSNKTYTHNFKLLKSIFDFKLSLFRSIKDETESKIDQDIKISDLAELGLLKSHKFPFLSLVDSRNFNKIKKVDDNIFKSKSFDIRSHLDLIYKNYLPRNYISYALRNSSIDITDLFKISKNAVNVFSKLEINPMIGEAEIKIDWFIYNDESLSFLMNSEREEISFSNSNLFKIVNNKVYFQDKLPYMILPNKTYKSFLVSISVTEEIKLKMEASLTCTAVELLRKVNAKLQIPRPEMCFDIKKKILKVFNICDYFLEEESLLGISRYINNCIKMNKTPELVIVDHPSVESSKKELIIRRRSSSLNHTKIQDIQANKLKKQNTIFSNIELGRNNKATIISKSPFPPNRFLSNKTNLEAKPIKTGLLISNFNNSNNKIGNNVNLPNQNQNQNQKPLGIDLITEKESTKKINDIIQTSNNNNEIQINTQMPTPISSTKSNIINIAVFNPELFNFSDFKGIRRRQVSENTKKITYTNCEFFGINFNEIIMNSREKKLKVGDSDTSSVKDEVEEFIREKRSRSKAIRSVSGKTSVRVTGVGVRKSLNTKDTNLSKISNSEKIEIKLEELITSMNSNIPLVNVKLPFNLKIHILKLKDSFLKGFSLHQADEKYLNLELEVQMFCGTESISDSHKIVWKGISQDVTALIRKQLYFNIKYCDVPIFSCLIFRLRTSVKVPKEREQKEGKSVEKKTIAWLNFRVFDHLKRLKTGMHRASLHDTKFSDDSYFSNIDNPKENTGDIFFELERFARPVEYQNINEEVDLFRPEVKIISSNHQIVIDRLLSKSPLEDLSKEEKEVLWVNRNLLTEIPELIPRIFSCVDKKNMTEINEIERLILTCKPVPIIQAMQLLSGNYLYDSIRKFAVYSLQQLSFLDIMWYLPQLTQSLKYEVYHDSPLANFLLKLAAKNPLTIGHQLFWNFKAEMPNENFKQRFGLYLEVFLGKIDFEINKVFQDEVWFFNRLLKVVDIAFNKNKEEIYPMLFEALEELNRDMAGREISIPYNFSLRVKGVKSSKCKFMKSKKKPLWLVFQNADENGDDIYVMLKKGDDLRQDVLTLQLFNLMQGLWFDQGIKLKMSNYNVISTGNYQGLLQIVTNSETLATIHKEYGGLTLGFSDKPLKHWMSKTITSITEKEYVNNFLLSSVAYCVATFVLGIGDRHNDNIMIKKNGELFHIDFGHFLGHFKSKFGIKRERAPFVFTSEFCNVLGGDKSENFNLFKELCVKSYMILRKNADVLITILKIMLCTGIPELTHSSIKFLDYSLALKMSDNEAEKFLLQKLDESMSSFSTKLNFAFHLIAN